MTDPIQPNTFKESVRKRPLMYIGNNGVIGLLTGLIEDCIALCRTDEILFEVSISNNNDFIFSLTSRQRLDPFLQQFNREDVGFKNYHPNVLKAVSKKFEVRLVNDSKIEICFSIDESVNIDTNIDYLKLLEHVLQLALLNRQCQFITIDRRQAYLNHNFFHFPQGVFYLFERALTEALGKPGFKISFDGQMESNKYQIGLAYRTDWFPSPNVTSFANDVHTTCGGSLVDGILEGLMGASRAFVKAQNLTTFKIRRKKFLNGLIIVCAVRGEEFKYGGSFKETLDDEIVKKQAKKIVHDLALEFFNNQKGAADKFLWRFDTSQLASGMY